jgi:hypothetical protein
MLEKTIRFKDLAGNDVEETFCFHLSKAEIAEMELVHKGGLADYIRRIAADQNGAEIMAVFKEIIRKSVGRRSDDNRRFLKNSEIADDFMQTDAYSELFIQLVTNAEAAVEFMNGIVPSDLRDAVTTQTIPFPGLEGTGVTVKAEKPKTWEDFTTQELIAMPPHEFQALINQIPGKNIPRDLLVIAARRQ